MYAAEMFASHAGRQHVICLTIIGSRFSCPTRMKKLTRVATGDLLYVWRYNRHRAIQCSALNFIKDLPRFLVLLLAMQRFHNRHWGLHPLIDPKFGELAEPPPNSPVVTTMLINDREQGRVDVTLDWSSENRVSHYGLNGRATNVYPATSNKFASRGNLVAKLFWTEESRTSEPEILKKVYEIAEKEPEVRNHVPDMVFFHELPESSTTIIRKRLRLPEEGA